MMSGSKRMLALTGMALPCVAVLCMAAQALCIAGQALCTAGQAHAQTGVEIQGETPGLAQRTGKPARDTGTPAGETGKPARESGALRQLSLIEGHYRRGDGFRAETEVLRFLHEYPGHPAVADVELLRAKLYYGRGRYGESSLTLFSHLDRHSRHPSTRAAARLLTLSLVREGRLDEAEHYLPVLRRPGQPAPSLEPLKAPPADAVDPDTAVMWSTFLPGTGFFALGEPGKGFAGLGLNLLLTGAAVLSFEEDQPVAGVLFLIAEIALYRGGREAVRDSAEAQLAAMERERRGSWARRQGEGELLGVGLTMKFSGG